MNKNRREFLQMTGIAGVALAGANIVSACNLAVDAKSFDSSESTEDQQLSIIGLYGSWAASESAKELPELSFRRKEWDNVQTWRKIARERLIARLGIPAIGQAPKVTLVREYIYDGLHIEELSWQLPYGRSTEAVLLKPADAKGPLPGILAFHDHGGDKYHGKMKIIATSEQLGPLIEEHQKNYYEGRAWANEIAKMGYAVLVSDAFTFASRKVRLEDVPARLRDGLDTSHPDKPDNIKAYNKWAGQHEHVMAKSLFSAGLTWPGVFLAEDRIALDILCAREDVDAKRIGCAGLSGGGLRSLYMGALDDRIKCCVPVGFMTTSKDLIMHKSYTHTWMTFTPMLPKELDFAEIVGVRAPLPTLVLNNIEDGLFTLDEMKDADRILNEVYKKAGADESYKCSFHPGPHKFDIRMQQEAFEWFGRWLKA
jgi:dienelactone hydrolase